MILNGFKIYTPCHRPQSVGIFTHQPLRTNMTTQFVSYLCLVYYSSSRAATLTFFEWLILVCAPIVCLIYVPSCVLALSRALSRTLSCPLLTSLQSMNNLRPDDGLNMSCTQIGFERGMLQS